MCNRRCVIESCIADVSSSSRETVLREICFLMDPDRRTLKKMRRGCLMASRCVFPSFSWVDSDRRWKFIVESYVIDKFHKCDVIFKREHILQERPVIFSKIPQSPFARKLMISSVFNTHSTLNPFEDLRRHKLERH